MKKLSNFNVVEETAQETGDETAHEGDDGNETGHEADEECSEVGGTTRGKKILRNSRQSLMSNATNQSSQLLPDIPIVTVDTSIQVRT